MLDRDLAALYGVSTGNLNKSVKRNKRRFPDDFIFQLSEKEYKNLMFQNGISSWGGLRKLPNVFTEQGVAMLSGVLNSDTAIEVNIRIIRIFTKLREMSVANRDIFIKIEQLEKQVDQNSEDVKMIFSALKNLLNSSQEPKSRIGFKRMDENF